jgi:hypothetical protein
VCVCVCVCVCGCGCGCVDVDVYKRVGVFLTRIRIQNERGATLNGGKQGTSRLRRTGQGNGGTLYGNVLCICPCANVEHLASGGAIISLPFLTKTKYRNKTKLASICCVPRLPPICFASAHYYHRTARRYLRTCPDPDTKQSSLAKGAFHTNNDYSLVKFACTPGSSKLLLFCRSYSGQKKDTDSNLGRFRNYTSRRVHLAPDPTCQLGLAS